MLSAKRTPEPVSAEPGLVGHARAIVSEVRATVAPTLISTDFVVRGTLNSSGEIQIDGRLEGDATCCRLVIGEGASVEGRIAAETVEIRGRVQGEIRAQVLRLGPQSHVEADLVYATLVIEDGAVFAGACRRADNPLSEDASHAGDPAQRLALVDTPEDAPAEVSPPGADEPVHALMQAITERLPELAHAKTGS